MSRKLVLILISAFFLFSMKVSVDGGFRDSQKKYARVKTAYSEKQDTVKNWLKQKSIDISTVNIFIRAFKKEQLIELWAKNKAQSEYKLIHTFDICASSGTIGPKRKQGDG